MAVSYRIHKAAVAVRAQVKSCGICGGQIDTEAGLFCSTSVSPASSHSTDCCTLIFIDHPEVVQYAKWWPTYQVDSVSSHPQKLKKELTYPPGMIEKNNEKPQLG
jgi:hypothetical protein